MMNLMKLAAAAALTISTLAVPVASADAQNRWHHGNGHHNGWNRHHRQRVCRWVWRHHHRQRVCYWRTW